ncbi:peroxidase [Cytophagaceae bacterium SJW1-29]|uniref:Peroxidase n=1 Tax=Salmonirosea aquatica TaxID=2654236 RepID=A0A7C9FCI9_9BACT|nr:peroxidase [Cytophagaceae bacterium SJW1-29]
MDQQSDRCGERTYGEPGSGLCIRGGPEDEPFLYDKPARGLYLLTGKSNNNQGTGTTLEKHDLPRTGPGTAIIGDPRNDENRVLSQLQLAFIRFYNALYQDLKTKYEAAGIAKIPAELYEEARRLTTWHYQWIVVNEFLPLLCGRKVVQNIMGNGRQFYKPCIRPYIPVEFSVAAYRFGHSMIAQKVKLQTGGTEHSIFSSQFGQGFAKITSQNQIVDWDVFFDFDGTYQRAETLNTKLASVLLELPFVNSTNPGDKSLATRNLRRAQSFLLPSGENVARCMGRSDSEMTTVTDLIHNLASTNSVDLSAGTPLWFYILAEAEAIGRMEDDGSSKPGEGLGPVGATIVAEVIIGLLELDVHSFLGSNRDWTPALGTAGAFTMKDLLQKSLTAIEL